MFRWPSPLLLSPSSSSATPFRRPLRALVPPDFHDNSNPSCHSSGVLEVFKKFSLDVEFDDVQKLLQADSPVKGVLSALPTVLFGNQNLHGRGI